MRMLAITVSLVGAAALFAVLTAAGLNAQSTTSGFVCPPCGCRADDDSFQSAGSCPACGMALVEKTADNEKAEAIFSFHKVSDLVMTAGQPTLAQMNAIKQAGVKTVINLRQPGEHAAAEEEEAKWRELGIRYINIPVNYLKPEEERATDFLKVTDEVIADAPVFIHCTAAIRVGAFWMIRRVLRDGWSFEKALEEANRIGLRDRQHLIDFAKSYIERHRTR